MFFGSVEKPPRLSEFELEVPERLVAKDPLKKRDDCNLMVLNRAEQSIEHRKFKDIVDYFDKGDVIVMNNTRVYPARLYAKKDKSDARVEVFLLRELADDLWEAMVKPARKVRIGNKLWFSKTVNCDVIDNTVSGGRVLRFEYDGDSLHHFIEKAGHSPLPPYIDRESTPSDKTYYQTVYASERGSVAAPTAGTHFSKPLLNRLEKKGVKLAYITLHIGLGTFRPIMVEDLTRHSMDSEYFFVPHETADLINKAKAHKKSVGVVGTSAVRTLETVVVSGFKITSRKGWTDKFIYPPYDFKMCDKLITNFHQPQSTLMMLTAAFAKKDFVLKAYKEAIKKKYRFYSYGDAMIII
ncbi:MAG: tRNA preQ1(34) S-adenosylmethionine ribosyltransferase-isomerase QueA [Candidatus Marinimicrobia bacterium]|jgi:S-adenosylmethionine:tRNA ribosyltransferase-isomerase|nr:tRNA preQ1(34) S-adenosylmethionine ribosyltransferase-isomerase QueA [Candidatus Neomarinimicrobiota bacterium]MDP6852891.1 tRNA preQ1(34) S-adenosylmethionine ribosyltransferase-isomerase QueA [Candidatus Neomarinimicrobiota bacterium]MDP6936472.1 tRNA preQ1(34) S-adenosylmethionine ribosyltransferase-isomerase QueA [Candidatus Neomarinimicrobiota bacterium]